MICFGLGILFCGLLCVVRGLVERRDILLHMAEADNLQLALEFVNYIFCFARLFIILGFAFLCIGIIYSLLTCKEEIKK